uniref:Uncharacterized protein n=1 Tax=Anguilla anguilla TaxID=7936 RepID=A0A0E9TR19_ANGAN
MANYGNLSRTAHFSLSSILVSLVCIHSALVGI